MREKKVDPVLMRLAAQLMACGATATVGKALTFLQVKKYFIHQCDRFLYPVLCSLYWALLVELVVLTSHCSVCSDIGSLSVFSLCLFCLLSPYVFGKRLFIQFCIAPPKTQFLSACRNIIQLYLEKIERISFNCFIANWNKIWTLLQSYKCWIQIREKVPAPFIYNFLDFVLTENNFPISQIHQTLTKATHKKERKKLTEWLTCNPEEDVGGNITFALLKKRTTYFCHSPKNLPLCPL